MPNCLICKEEFEVGEHAEHVVACQCAEGETFELYCNDRGTFRECFSAKDCPGFHRLGEILEVIELLVQQEAAETGFLDGCLERLPKRLVDPLKEALETLEIYEGDAPEDAYFNTSWPLASYVSEVFAACRHHHESDDYTPVSMGASTTGLFYSKSPAKCLEEAEQLVDEDLDALHQILG